MAFDMNELIEWVDIFWVIVALLLLQGKQKIQGALFALACVFSLRLQIELMQEIGYPDGFVGLIDFPLLYRGFIAYGIFVAGFLSLLHLSKDDSAYIFMAASITVFIVSFCVSSFVLIL